MGEGELGKMGRGQAKEGLVDHSKEIIRLCSQCSGKALEGFKQGSR